VWTRPIRRWTGPLRHPAPARLRVLAGGFSLVIGLMQTRTRDGYDPTRHDRSLLANSPDGWIQIATFTLRGW
jgi:hypothetical protein